MLKAVREWFRHESPPRWRVNPQTRTMEEYEGCLKAHWFFAPTEWWVGLRINNNPDAEYQGRSLSIQFIPCYQLLIYWVGNSCMKVAHGY